MKIAHRRIRILRTMNKIDTSGVNDEKAYSGAKNIYFSVTQVIDYNNLKL